MTEYEFRHSIADLLDPANTDGAGKLAIAQYLANRQKPVPYQETHDIDMENRRCRSCGLDLQEIEDLRIICRVRST